jgi:cation diffusion facilitator CzcD-associated flavoprotein CzcO
MKPDYQVAIVGAGFAGIAAALRLKNSERNSFVILERASEIGGTWRDNIYPGCGCDVPSYLYSIASEPNPDWQKMFSLQPEILEYLKNIVIKNQLKNHIRYNTELVRAEFVADKGYWQITDHRGNVLTASMLIAGLGPLNRPNIPSLKGIENFKGEHFHSSNWKHTCDLTHKRVAVIGTGASAIQFIPAIANKVGSLTVFQRTAAWVAPRNDSEISTFQQQLFKRLPMLQKTVRTLIFWILELRGMSFVGNKMVRTLLKKQALKHLKTVENAVLRQKLTPNYEYGCKRVLISDDYYPTFNRSNVAVVTENIEHITDHEIITKDGQKYVVDVLIYGTGFVAAEIITDAKIFGLNGRELFAEWLQTGPEAYRGTTVSGFPNLAVLLGPNTGLGHNSVVHIIESQLSYVMQYIETLEKNGLNSYLDVKPDVQMAYNQTIQSQLKNSVWASGCKSWYMTASGKNTTIWPKLANSYRKLMRNFEANDYSTFITPFINRQ